MAERVSITSPVGRLVAGSLYKGNDKDFDGNPLVDKEGKPYLEYYFALALPKTKANWWEEDWGKVILNVGAKAFPGSYNTRRDFAWKITDGDSTDPGKSKTRTRPCDREGYADHWVLNMRSGFVPKTSHIVNNEAVPLNEEGAIKTGYYVQVMFYVKGNDNQNNPGVYLNHAMVCLRGYGSEITSGPDLKEAGFGGGTLPQGASAIPLASPAPFPSMATVPSAGVPPASIPAPSAPAAPASSPIPVLPNPQFLQMPAPGAGVPQSNPPSGAQMPSVGAISAPPASASPSSGPRYRMTAQGTREEWHAKGWTDAQMIQGGYMVQE